MMTGESKSIAYDAVLIVSFGGPEGLGDVLPFLENVTRGKNVPHQRLIEVAERYAMFDGVSPLNAEVRALIAALVDELNTHGPALPVYWGNRNWHPMLADAIEQMAQDGVRRALAFVMSPFGSYSSCRQYQEDIELARQEVGPDAPHIDKLRLFYNHPGFIEATADRTIAALEQISDEQQSLVQLLFTAHSIPLASAERSPYVRQLREACRLVMAEVRAKGEDKREKVEDEWSISWKGRKILGELVFQSRSGPPSQAWLEPDIRDRVQELSDARNVTGLVIVPIGFLAENMEVVYDLDVETCGLCNSLGLSAIRADVVGRHPSFVRMIRELIGERVEFRTERVAIGRDAAWPDECPGDCCMANKQ